MTWNYIVNRTTMKVKPALTKGMFRAEVTFRVLDGKLQTEWAIAKTKKKARELAISYAYEAILLQHGIGLIKEDDQESA